METTAPARAAPQHAVRVASQQLAADDVASVPLHAPRPAWLTRHAVALVVLDALAMTVATLTAKVSWLGFDAEPLFIRSFSIPHAALTVVTVPTWIAILGVTGAYDLGPFANDAKVWSRLVRGGAQLLAVIAVAYYFVHLEQLGRGILVGLIPLAVVLTAAGRYAAQVVLSRLRRHGWSHRTALLVGHRRSVESARHQIDARPEAGITVVGTSLVGVDDRVRPAPHPPGQADGGPGRSDAVAQVARALARTGAESVIVTGGLEHGELRRIAWMIEGTGIALLVTPAPADLQEIGSSTFTPLAGVPLLRFDA